MYKCLCLAILTIVATHGLVATTPPLPPGAYAEWDSAKAWQQHSDTRSKICINGLWQFRSEPRLQPVEKITPFYSEDGAPDTSWDITSMTNATVTGSRDSSRKTHGEASTRIDLEVPPATNFYHVTRIIPGIPTGVKLVARVDVWSEMERGDVHIEVQDSRDYTFHTTAGSTIAPKAAWQTIECEFMLPKDSPGVKILVPRNHGSTSGLKGQFWLDNLRIVQVEHLPSPGIALPADDAWGFSKVPGSWYGRVYWHDDDPARSKANDLRFAWYRRDVSIPADWSGRHVSVRLDRVATDARVYCNGHDAGAVPFMGGDVDITPWVEFGKSASIAVLVEARNSWRVMPDLFTKPNKVWAQRLSAAGILGDVFLQAEATGIRLGPCRIVTTVADHRLRVQAPIITATDLSAADLSWRCDIRDGDRVVKSFTGNAPAATSEIVAETQWSDVELWDIDNPKLYTLTITLLRGDAVLDQSLPQRFGFRDFVIRGKYFYLNGVKINLASCSYWTRKGNWHTPEAIRHWLEGAKAAGYTFVYVAGIDTPGLFPANRPFLEACDELGMLAAITPAAVNSIYRRLDEPAIWDQWTKLASICVDAHRNHPSLVLWRMNMNMQCYAQDQNPLLLDGKMDFEPGTPAALREEAMLKSNAYVRSIDPSRHTYNHACGKTGEIYNLNNYLGWPEIQDHREWLRVWATQGDKPLYMAEQATPYPGDFQMRDPSVWWANEPVMTEYGAIALGEKSYELEEQDYVDYISWCWRPKERKWNSSYGYFCNNYPPILDEAATRYYEETLPAWRTWGISGGVNAWENAWRRLIKPNPGSVFRQTPPNLPLDTDWAALQHPGASADEWVYDGGGGGEIRSLFDLGRPEEKEYYAPTRRGKVYPTLIAPLFAYLGGPDDLWYTQDHAFRSGENIGKSLIVINDRRKTQSFQVSWQASRDGKVFASDSATLGIPPAETSHLQIRFAAPTVTARSVISITAKVLAGDDDVPVKPMTLQVYPPAARAAQRNLAQWAIFDPTGKSTAAFARLGYVLPAINDVAALPASARVLVVGCGALDDAEAADAALAGLAERVRKGLQVLVLEQTAETMNARFGLRAFTPGVRQVWVRQDNHPFLRDISNDDLADWRGQTTLGPLDGPPKSLTDDQRPKRTWRCSQFGVVASTIVEMPHVVGFSPIVDTGFDLRYSALWENHEGMGRMVFCLLDVSDRAGKDPIVDTLLHNIVGDLDQPTRAFTAATTQLVAPCADAPLSALSVNSAAPALADAGPGHVLVIPRGAAAWLEQHGNALADYLTRGGRVLAVGLTLAEGQALSAAVGNTFNVSRETHWLNPLHSATPTAFHGVSPAAIRWRLKLECTVVNTVPTTGWRNDSGVLASIPVGKGHIVWLAATPADFDAEQRPDLVFSRVKTERLITTVLGNLDVQCGRSWADALEKSANADSRRETDCYSDTRRLRDDPYATMRW